MVPQLPLAHDTSQSVAQIESRERNLGQPRRPFKTRVDRGKEEAKEVGKNRKRDLLWSRNMGAVACRKHSVLPIGIVTVGRTKDCSAHGNPGRFQETT